MLNILKQAKDYIIRNGLIENGDKIVVGVSGGPDSLTLLLLLDSLKEEFDLKLHIAHLDHMMRPDSKKDSEFVYGFGKSLGIPVTVERADFVKISQQASLEEVMRKARLDFLFRVCKKEKAKKIALGHNFDDQAETVLMRILRGSGLFGLTGILAKRKINSFCIIRPLLGIRRKEIEGFLKKKRISPRIDSSNQDERFFRNKIRRTLLPLLEKEYNKNIREVLSNLAQSAGNDFDYLSNQALNKALNSGFSLKLKLFVREHPSMQMMLLRLYIEKIQGSLRRISYQHLKELQDLAFRRPINSIVHLPKGVYVIKNKNTLIFKKKFSK